MCVLYDEIGKIQTIAKCSQYRLSIQLRVTCSVTNIWKIMKYVSHLFTQISYFITPWSEVSLANFAVEKMIFDGVFFIFNNECTYFFIFVTASYLYLFFSLNSRIALLYTKKKRWGACRKFKKQVLLVAL